MKKAYRVRAARCSHRASEGEIDQVLRRVTDPLERSWQRLECAGRIVVKFNMMKLPHRLHYFKGRRRELVDDAVCRAVLRLLRDRTNAELIVTDTNAYTSEHLMGHDFNYAHILREFDVAFVDSNTDPIKSYEVPGEGLMFDRYELSGCFEGAEVVSVSKMKNHLFMGVTLCMKNLFGLPPITPPRGRTRAYYHHFIRLSYLLPDLARITDPALNIIDALTGQWGREWDGVGRVCDALIAGDHITATDACGAHLMGHDPASDWPIPPFRRDRNHLLMAARSGYGTVDLNEIDFVSEIDATLAEFDSEETDPLELVQSWRRTTCEQALIYRDRSKSLIDRHRGSFIFLQDGDVVWSGNDPSNLGSRRALSGKKRHQGMWLKLVDPEETEGERFEVYDACLREWAA